MQPRVQQGAEEDGPGEAPAADLASLAARVRAAAERRDHAAVAALLAEASAGYEAYAAAGPADVSRALQTEVSVSSIVRASALALEARVARLAEGLSSGFVQGLLGLLPQAGGAPGGVDLCALADRFQAAHAARFPPALSPSAYARYSASRAAEGGAADARPPGAPQRARAADPPGEQVVERRRYEALTMCGAELQEQRKQALLQRIAELSRGGFYPLAFVFLKPGNFTQTVHAIFDIAQLYAEGAITIRKYTDRAEQQRLYAVHNLQIDPDRHEYESLYVRSKSYFCDTQQSNDQGDSAHCSEFSPAVWKGLSTVLSMDMDRAKKLSQKFGIQ